jgi:hypothetical protein
MKKWRQDRGGSITITALQLCVLFVVAAGLFVPGAWCQGAAADQQNTELQPPVSDVELQQATMNASNLEQLNQNAGSISYTDGVRKRSPFSFATEFSGVWTSNIYNTVDTTPRQSGSYLDIGVPVALQLSGQQTNFSAYFHEDANIYPGYSDLTHTSETYSHQLTFRLSDRTLMSWSLAGGRIVTVGNYLFPIISVGSTGIALPQNSGGLKPMYNAATTYAFVHQLSERDTLTASGTGGWLDDPEGESSVNGQNFSYHQWTGGGALQWQHALSPQRSVAVEVTDVYIKSLSPPGTGNFTTLSFTYSWNLARNLTFNGGAGPLFLEANQSGSEDVNKTSYNANASLDYRSRIGEIRGGYSRVYQISYLSEATIVNELSFELDHPLSRAMTLTAAGNYMRSPFTTNGNSQDFSQFGLSARLNIQLSHGFLWHVDESSFIQDAVTSATGNPGYHNYSLRYGITYSFGNSASHGEEQE